MALQEVKGYAFYEAMVKNGLEQIRGKYVNVDNEGKIVSGCLMTQAAYNLSALITTPGNDSSVYFDRGDKAEEIDEAYTVYGQLRQLTVPETSKWFVAKYHSLADTLIYWYDKREPEPTGPDWTYLLATYQDALAMAHDLLEPHFEQVFTLDVSSEWTAPYLYSNVDSDNDECGPDCECQDDDSDSESLGD